MLGSEPTEETQLLVIGGGPGGYVAAFKAADLGIRTTLVDAAPVLGGVCLRQGCIPSKALLHISHLINHAAEAEAFGVTFGEPEIDIPRLRDWKQSVVDKLCAGVETLAKNRKVRVIHGEAKFDDSGSVRIEGGDAARLRFEHAIVATGSRPARLPELVMPADCCIDSTGALALPDIPETLAVIGGGYIGLELGQVYAALGSRITVIEMLPQLLPGADADLVRPLAARLRKEFEAIHTSAELKAAQNTSQGVELTFTKGGRDERRTFERVLVAVGRKPNSEDLGLENTKVKVDEHGFVEVNAQRRTADERIFAIGDVAGEPMLAHKASREGVVAVETIAGRPSVFEPRAIPAVVYTSPEVAWCGLTEAQAREQHLEIEVGKAMWGSSGRALTMGRPEGTTKIIADANTRRVLGVGIVGEHAGDLIAEATTAIEMGATVDQLATIIHAHPTGSETIMEAAEAVFGRALHSTR
ncbi:MAG: dihydrolipoyl dehydrogenase [Planctomycetes bacterium]|nr:dihydrolipoyl dehydrogenase [Planctomycetota bacterium]